MRRAFWALMVCAASSTTGAIGPAAAQTYDPAYPVCLHLYGRGGNYYECRYTSLPQCLSGNILNHRNHL
jgi:hypothetical protein